MAKTKKYQLFGNKNERSIVVLMVILAALIYTVYTLQERQNVAPQRSQAAIIGNPVCTADFTVAAGPTLAISPTPRSPSPPPSGCLNYGIDEHSGENLSNIISIQLTPSKDISKVNTLYCSSDGICDAEAMDNRGSTVYLVANKKSPALYTINKTPGGSPKVRKIANLNRTYEGLSFRPGDALNLVWGGGRNNHIYKLNLNGSEVKDYGPAGVTIKTITWDNTGTYLYVSSGNKLHKFFYDLKKDSLAPAGSYSLPGKTDGMDMTTDGYIVGGYKSGGDLIIYFFDVNRGKVVSAQRTSLASYNKILTTTKSGTQYDNLDAFTWLCGKKP